MLIFVLILHFFIADDLLKMQICFMIFIDTSQSLKNN